MIGAIRLATVAATAAALSVGAGTASASTVAYVKDGAVWVSAPDGSDAHEVGAGLTYPSLADDGTVFALTGAQVAALPPGAPARAPIGITAAATDLDVSPDGGEIAWQDLHSGLDDLQHGVTVERLADGRWTNVLGDERPRWLSPTQLTVAGPSGRVRDRSCRHQGGPASSTSSAGLTVRAALRHGIKVSVNARGPGTLTARARVVGHASAYHLRRATVASERAADRPLRRVR